jgi:hypothetical protein
MRPVSRPRRPPIVLGALALTALVALAFASPTAAAEPRYLMVYGAPLARPVILDDLDENLDFMLAITEPAGVGPDALAGRPSLSLALFWQHQTWEQYVRASGSLAALRPEQAEQRGRFYPASGTTEPIVVLDAVPGPGTLVRRVAPQGLAILARHGVPTRLDPAPAAGGAGGASRSPLREFALGLLVAAILAGGGLIRRQYAAGGGAR